MGMAARVMARVLMRGQGSPLALVIQAVRMMAMPMVVKPMNWVRCLAAFPTAVLALRTKGHGGGVEDAGAEVAGH